MRTITIVGGGVAGLALAAALDPEIWDATLIEQRPSVPDVGTAFGIWPVAQHALGYLGLDDLLRDHSLPITSGRIADSDDRTIIEMRKVAIRLLTRPALLTALAAAVPEGVRRITRRILDPHDLAGDLVVAADGARSRVRAGVWGDTARSVGTWAIRGVLPVPAPVEGMAEYWGRPGLFGISPNPGSTTNWYATLTHVPGAPAEAIERLRQTHAGFPEPVLHVLHEAHPERTLVNEILVSPIPRGLVRGRYVLVGDAAHAMTPSLGRGACEALVDAVCLAHELNRRGPDGARAYQRQRLVAAQGVRIGASLALALQESGPRAHALLRRVGPRP